MGGAAARRLGSFADFTATLSTTTPGVTVLQAARPYSAISPGGTGTNAAPFVTGSARVSLAVRRLSSTRLTNGSIQLTNHFLKVLDGLARPTPPRIRLKATTLPTGARPDDDPGDEHDRCGEQPDRGRCERFSTDRSYDYHRLQIALIIPMERRCCWPIM